MDDWSPASGAVTGTMIPSQFTYIGQLKIKEKEQTAVWFRILRVHIPFPLSCCIWRGRGTLVWLVLGN
jgi:hypothetical protein